MSNHSSNVDSLTLYMFNDCILYLIAAWSGQPYTTYSATVVRAEAHTWCADTDGWWGGCIGGEA